MSHLIQRAAVFVLLCLSCLPVAAQSGADVGAKIRETEALIAAEFRQILREEMLFTAAESEAFWPLYERYSAERRVISDRYFASLIEYVDRYYNGDLTDAQADRMVNTYFEVQREILDKRRSYAGKFGKIMSGVKVLRFFQLENKVQAEVNAALARVVPLADPR